MKVLQIVPSFFTVGAEIMSKKLIYALKDKGAQVIAID